MSPEDARTLGQLVLPARVHIHDIGTRKLEDDHLLVHRQAWPRLTAAAAEGRAPDAERDVVLAAPSRKVVIRIESADSAGRSCSTRPSAREFRQAGAP